MMIVKALKQRYSELRSDVKKANPVGMLRLPGGLREFFREQVSVKQAEDTIKKALESREERFLETVLTHVYKRPNSPYLKLLEIAGCDFSDLQTQVHRCGVEQTLQKLAREGVYFTSEEFKGKKEVIRGQHSFHAAPNCFDNPALSAGYRMRSSGTVNPPVNSFVSLGLLALRTPATCVFFAAHNLFSYVHAMYDAILPALRDSTIC